MRLWIAIITLIIMSIDNGCAPSKHIVNELGLSPDEVVRRVHERDHQITTLKGNGSITVESPDVSNSGSFDVDVKKPDSLRVEFHGPFGIHIGTLSLSPERFMFYDWRENIATIGKPDGTTLRSMFRITLQFDEILRAFTGEFLSNDIHDSLEQFTVTDGLYVVRYHSHGDIKEYRIDPGTFVVTSYRLLDVEGKPKMITLASRFDDDQVVPMPKVLRVIIPQEHRSVTIAYSNVKINQPVQCSFTLPQQAEVINR